MVAKKSKEPANKPGQKIAVLRAELAKAHKAFAAERAAKRSIANQLLNIREVLQDALGEDKKKIEWDDVALVKRLVAQRDVYSNHTKQLLDVRDELYAALPDAKKRHVLDEVAMVKELRDKLEDEKDDALRDVAFLEEQLCKAWKQSK